MSNLQQQVQQAIDDLVESGVERGLQVAVYQHGTLIVDAVAGVADPETEHPVTSDTPFFSYSIGKGMAATVVHRLAERGALDYDTPIVELWPEFGARMYAALLGEVDGARLISPERLREASAVAMSGVDQVFGFPSAWGLGYSLGQSMANAHETQHVFGVGGVGGSHAYADTKNGIAFALTMNRLAQSFETADRIGGIVTRAVAEG